MPSRHYFVPEVIQTSAMDCGPAALKALLEGFGVAVSYGRLREACQTSVDGTSIDTLEQIAGQLGLAAYQVMLPADFMFLNAADAMPALVVVTLPTGLTHFVVVWRISGPWVQVMDPGVGRRWLTRRQFIQDVYTHAQIVPPELWENWAQTDNFQDILYERLADLGIDDATAEDLVALMEAHPGWQTPAALDAAIRMSAALVAGGGVEAGTEAARVVRQLVEDAVAGDNPIPDNYWTVRPSRQQPGAVVLRGAVLVMIKGLAEESEERPPLAPELAAALHEPARRPERFIWQALRADGLLTPTIVLIALVLSTLGMTLQILLFKSLLDLGGRLDTVDLRIGAMEALLAFLGLMVVLNLPVAAAAVRMGRHVEMRLRMAFLRKIPRLGDRYFHSRLTSDMARRAYDLRELRNLPPLAIRFFTLLFSLIFTIVAIGWLSPRGLLPALLAGGKVLLMSLFTHPLLREQDMRLQSYHSSLSRFYLDGLQGLTAIRAHSAAGAVRREYESLLCDWLPAEARFQRTDLSIRALERFSIFLFAVWILYGYVSHGGEAVGVLVLMFWTLQLPELGNALAQVIQQYPFYRNRVLRLMEPLDSPEETEFWYTDPPPRPAAAWAGDPPPPSREAGEEPKGAGVVLDQVQVSAGGHHILHEIHGVLAPGEHVAVVGQSGAGKSSLAGLLLGWHRPAHGSVWVDGELLDGPVLRQLRRDTAWVDPSVQLWNRSLQHNLRYGAEDHHAELDGVITQADLAAIVEKLPDGLHTPLGESGGLVSGGEGQRVRLARALFRPGVRLVILDEPFRGLDREKRRLLLARARAHWARATLLFISHDLGDTRDFARVWVMEQGRIVEDAAPQTLLETDSRYRALYQAEQAVRHSLWEDAAWRRLWLEGGELRELGGKGT